MADLATRLLTNTVKSDYPHSANEASVHLMRALDCIRTPHQYFNKSSNYVLYSHNTSRRDLADL